MRVNKRAQNLTLGTILLMLLGVVVVVVLLWGATAGFDNFWDTITGYRGTSNVDTIAQACNLACTSKQEYGFCSELRGLKIANKKATKGSCFDFAMRNPGLGIDNCDICSGSSSGGCKIGNDVDLGCDGEVDSLGSKGEVGEEGEAGVGGEEFENQILEFKGSGDYEVLSLEECKKTLEERKKNLEIPDKLCYWEEMTKLYDEKCDNLDKEEISEIFEKKEEYRKLNNEDWPTLNTDGDFCFPVIYDCHNYKQNKERSFGGCDYEKKIIYINPFLDVQKNFFRETLIHEALHSIQSIESANLLGGPVVGINVGEELRKLDKGVNEIYKKQKVLVENVENILEEFPEDELKAISELSGTEEFLLRYDKIEKDYDFVLDYFVKMKINANVAKITNHKDFVSKDNIFYKYLETNEEYKKAVVELNSFLEIDFKKYVGLLTAYGYTANMIELDPRLSEVNRWWLDRTAPDCEIITTSERAEEILKKFLEENEMDESYILTQIQLKNVLEVAKIKEIEQEIYDKLANRIPGLAMDDSLTDDGSALA